MKINKSPSLKSGILFIITVISIFSFVMFSSKGITNNLERFDRTKIFNS